MGTVRVNSIVINNASGTYSRGPFKYRSKIVSVDLNNNPWTNNSMHEAFNYCTNLTTVTNIDDNVTNMQETFAYCNSMINAPVLPNSVKSLFCTFYACRRLVNAPIIPNSVENMNRCFLYCSNLVNAPIIPNSVENLEDAFNECQNLQTVPIIPNSVTNISYAFVNCRNITSTPIIPSSIIQMGSTFHNCINLTGEIYIDSTQINSAYNCFGGTSLPKTLYLPYNASLGISTDTYNTFVNSGYTPTSSKDGVTVQENPHFEKYGDWWWCKYDGIIHKCTLSTGSTSITVPGVINGINTKFIGTAAFPGADYTAKLYNGRTLTSIDLNNSVVTTNAHRLFSYCSNLVTINNLKLDDNIKDLSYAFYSCENLSTVPILPNGAQNLSHTFGSCRNLSSCPVIPNSVTNMFYTFSSASTNRWTSVANIPDSVIDMSDCFHSALSNKALTINVGTGVQTLQAAFWGIYGNIYLKSNRVKYGYMAFGGTANRTNVYIPFTNSDGTPSATYTALTAQGYKTDGSYQNVYLINYAGLY